MSEKVWRIKTEGNNHVIKYTFDIEGGEIFLDGDLIDSRDSFYMGVLMQKSFKIEGKSAKIRRRTLLSEDWEFVYDGEVHAGEGQEPNERETAK